MATCNDCIHYPACKSCWCAFWEHQEMTEDDYCKMFKDKADFIEVVRCKDCMYARQDKISCQCKKRGIYVGYLHYCGYGKKKEGANNG